MSEVQSRSAATRGRGSARGGRGGGFSTRGGGRAGTRTNGDTKHDADSSLPTLEDEGEIGQLKNLYGSKVAGIKEMFPDWSDVDILYALQETDGDQDLAGTRIAEGELTCLTAFRPRLPSSPSILCHRIPSNGALNCTIHCTRDAATDVFVCAQ